MKLNIFLFSIFIIPLINAEKRSYKGYSLFKITPTSEKDLSILIGLQKTGLGEFWSEEFKVNQGTKIMVPAVKKKLFLDIVGRSDLIAEEIINDLQRAIDDQLRRAQRTDQDSDSFLSMNWNQYYSLEEIHDWLDEVERNYPTIVSTVYIGSSVENRPIKGIKINYNPNRNDTLIGMFTGALHAREWITSTTLTWIIKEFLTSTDHEIRALAENFEWHLFPVVNPDGYSYTFTHDRMWRKNRSTANFTSCASTGVTDDMSNGVDLNRNFDFAWNTAGTSNDPCSNTFAGPAPFSEPETRAISQYVLNLNNHGRIIYYIDFHSYTQLVCIPYSNVSGSDVLLADNFANMYEIAARSAERLGRRFRTNYRVGVAPDVMYAMSGTSFDWVKYVANVPVSYLIELRDLGEYGFLLPPEQIIPNGLEIMDALIEMDKTTRTLGYYYSGTQSIVSSLAIVLAGVIVSFIY